MNRITALIGSLFLIPALCSPAHAQHAVVVARAGGSVSFARPAWGRKPVLIGFSIPEASTVFSPVCNPCGTSPNAINDFDVIAGTYSDANFVRHGFIRAFNGRILKFDAPGAGLGHGLGAGTIAYGINNFDAVVGSATNASMVSHGFVRSPSGAFVRIDVPGAGTASGTGTFAYDINLLGETAGSYVDARGAYHGFARSRTGTIVAFDPPASASTFVCPTTCLNVSGEIVGYYLDAGQTTHGFVRAANGKILVVDVPGAATQLGHGTQITGVNNGGTITGFYYDPSLTVHGFVRYPNGTLTTFNPAGTDTEPSAIDGADTVTGQSIDAAGNPEGFVRDAAGGVSFFLVPGALVTVPTSINFEGAIAGYYAGSNGILHGFLRI